jgi:hypothetical protein
MRLTFVRPSPKPTKRKGVEKDKEAVNGIVVFSYTTNLWCPNKVFFAIAAFLPVLRLKSNPAFSLLPSLSKTVPEKVDSANFSKINLSPFSL